jgi:hypothetical protein
MKNIKKIGCLLLAIIIIIVSLPSYSSAATKTGSIHGNITWQYNEYIGTKADVGAYVALIPIDTKVIKKKDHKLFSKLMLTKGKGGIYSTKVDGLGEYNIDDVPVGKYMIVVISSKTTSGERFDNEDEWNTSIDNMFGDFLTKKEMESIKLHIGYNSYFMDTIKIKKNKDTKFSHDFGYTYL